jgi:O-antigen ligase
MRPVQSLSNPGGAGSQAWAVPLAGVTGEPAARWSMLQLYVLGLWVLVLFDPQWLIASFGPTSHLPIVPFLIAAVLPLALWRRPPRDWFAPMLCYLGYQVVSVPFAHNASYALAVVKVQFLYYALALGTLVAVTRARQALTFVLLLVLAQYVWWAAHGAAFGYVRWHPTNANQDGFGALMVMGLASCVYVAQAARSRRVRGLSYLVAAACAVGVVTAVARGAVVAAGVILLYVWLRSPRKIRTAVAVVVVGTVIVLAANVLFPQGAFWREIQSAFSEGLEAGTGAERWELWKAAMKVFLDHPLFGAGPGNFGPYAASTFTVGEVAGKFADNPGRLYDQQLHSTYFQVLSELGIVGSCLFAWVVVDFWRVNVKLRSPDFGARWAAATGGRFDLRFLAWGLEAALVAFLVTSLLYVQLYVHWLWTLVTVNRLLFLVLRPSYPPILAWRRGGG